MARIMPADKMPMPTGGPENSAPITGKPTITVGSVGLTGEFLAAFAGESSQPSSLDELVRRMDRGDFDLVAVGRPLLSDPNWVKKIHEGRTAELKGFTKEALGELVLS